MTNQEISEMLKTELGINEVKVTNNGSHYQVIAIDDCFDAMTRVKRQQFVYAPLSGLISDGTIHAVSIKTFNSEQWQREKLFN